MWLYRLRRKLDLYRLHHKHPGRLFYHTVLEFAHRLHLIRMPVLPSMIDIEPNNYCNFRCPHCQVTHWSKPRDNLQIEQLTKILDQFPNLLRIKLQGMGEPLLNKQTLPMLACIESRGIKTEIISNGSVMTEAIAKTLHQLATDISFSIDGATAEVFERIRVGSSFAKVISNIKMFVSQRSNKFKRIEARTVITRLNFDQLVDIVRLVASLKLDKLTVQLVLNSWAKDDIKVLNDARRVSRADLDQHIALAKVEAGRLELPVYFQDEGRYSRRKKCAWPWRSSYIASNGDVVPCCILADSETVKMGNVFEQDFATIWNGQAYQELRKRIKNHDLPDYCRGCYGESSW